MVTIIHGDDIASSRIYFIALKQAKKDALLFNGEKITVNDLQQIIQGGQLFSDEKTIFIEDFFTKKKKGKDTDGLLAFFKQHAASQSFFFWESKEVTKKTTTLFPNATIKVFKYPQLLFSFLDSIAPKDGEKLVRLFHQVLEHSESSAIFYMLIRQVRLLLALPDDSAVSIDEVRILSPWQRSKLIKQARLFSQPQLINIYKKLYEIDLAQKTGKLSLSLTQTIDFLLLEI